MALKIRLRAEEHLVINGALVKATEPTTLLLMNHAKFMHDKQIMRPEQASTAAKRIYFAVQNAYLATPEERPAMLTFLRQLVTDFREATLSQTMQQKLDELAGCVGQENYYKALQIAREVIAYEDLVLGVGTFYQDSKEETDSVTEEP